MTQAKAGRPSGIRVDGQRLKHERQALSLTPESLAERLHQVMGRQVSASTLRRAEKGVATTENAVCLCSFFGIQPSEVITDPAYSPQALQRLACDHPPTPRQRFDAHPLMIDPTALPHPKQDVKNVIRSEDLSQRLLAGESPSLVQALRESAMFTPLNNDHKDIPFVPGSSHNHFLQLTAVVSLHDLGADQRYLLANIRDPGVSGPLMPRFTHTKGLSILWTTGFFCGLKHSPAGDLDQWLSHVLAGQLTATHDFEGHDARLLRNLLGHRLRLGGYSRTTRPLGIITRDQRSADRNRVYTHYTFEVEIRFSETKVDWQLMVDRLVVGPEKPRLVPAVDQVEQVLTNDRGRPLVMDLLAWRRLRNPNADTLRQATCSMTQGFEVI